MLARLTSLSQNEVCSCHLECQCCQERQRQRAGSTQRPSERTQRVEVLAAKPERVSSSSKAHMVTNRIDFCSWSSAPWGSSVVWPGELASHTL